MTCNQGGFVDNASNVPLSRNASFEDARNTTPARFPNEAVPLNTQEDICQRLLMENVRLLEKIKAIKTIAKDADEDHWGDRLDLIAKFLEDV